MNNSKTDCGAQIIKTAYGEKLANSISFHERAELISEVNEALSIRGINPKEFACRLELLLNSYKAIPLPPAKYIEEAPIRVERNVYKVRNKFGTLDTIIKN